MMSLSYEDVEKQNGCIIIMRYIFNTNFTVNDFQNTLLIIEIETL